MIMQDPICQEIWKLEARVHNLEHLSAIGAAKQQDLMNLEIEKSRLETLKRKLDELVTTGHPPLRV